MQRWKVVVSAPYARPRIERYRHVLERAGCEVLVACATERLEEDELIELLPGVHGIICGDDRITARVLDAASDLRVISKWGTGIDSIDVAEARRRGIVVCNTPNAFSEPVADTVMGYALIAARQLDRMNADMHGGGWRKPQLRSLGEQTLGIVGVGNCGRAVARRATAFGLRLLGADIVEIPASVRRATGLAQVPLSTLLRESDLVSLNCTLNDSSFHLINAETLSLMKPSAFLINTCRGPVVDERALEDALVEGRLAGAALDVFEEEPLPPRSRLRSLANCWLAPHNANSSAAAAERVHERTLQSLIEGLQGTKEAEERRRWLLEEGEVLTREQSQQFVPERASPSLRVADNSSSPDAHRMMGATRPVGSVGRCCEASGGINRAIPGEGSASDRGERRGWPESTRPPGRPP